MTTKSLGSRVRSPPVPVVLSVYQRGSLLDGLAIYLSCDTKKFHDNESTHILHNFWTSTHRGEASPPSPWRRHCDDDDNSLLWLHSQSSVTHCQHQPRRFHHLHSCIVTHQLTPVNHSLSHSLTVAFVWSQFSPAAYSTGCRGTWGG